MGRGIRRLLKTLIILGVVFGILIGLPLWLFHMKTEAPLDQYDEATDNAFFSSLDSELTALITDINEDEVSIRINEAFINRMLQKQLSINNPKFLDETYADDMEYGYMMVISEWIGVKGIWTELTDDELTVIAGADIAPNGNVLYQTGIRMVFNIVLSENDEYFFEVDEIKVGNIKLPKKSAFDFASSIVEMITSKSLNDMIAEHLSFGVFDDEEISFVIGEQGLTDYLYEIEPSFAALLRIVYQESLLIIDISEQGVDIDLTIGHFRRLSTDPGEPPFTAWEDDGDKAAFMADFASRAALAALMNPSDPYIDLTQEDANAILDYRLGEDVQFEVPFDFPVSGFDVEYTFASTNLFLLMDDNILSTHLGMSLTKDGQAGSFDMQFNMSLVVSMNETGDMVLEIQNSNIGTINLANDTIASLIGIFDETLMVDGDIVIPEETVNEMFEGSGIAINDSYVLNGKLRLHYGLAS